MKMIVGLGNPGAKYAANRHNIGFILLDALGDKHGSWREKFNALEMKIKCEGEDLILLKPQSFMNLSGNSVLAAAQFYKILPIDILVVHDELDIPPAEVKLKIGGGHAGHNGLRSIIGHMGADFARLRVGIGHPGDKNRVSDYVLSDFSSADQQWIGDLQDSFPKSIGHWVTGNQSRFIEGMKAG